MKQEKLERIGDAVGQKINCAPVFVNVKNSGLLMVDLVRGFCESGSGPLAPPTVDPVIESMLLACNDLAKVFCENVRPIFMYRDAHKLGQQEASYPVHCVEGSEESLLMPSMQWLEKETSVTIRGKDCTNGFVGSLRKDGSHDLIEWINDNALAELIVCGICTDICVMETVLAILSAKTRGMCPCLKDVIIPISAVATYDYPGVHVRDYTEFFGLYFMQMAGAIIAKEIVTY